MSMENKNNLKITSDTKGKLKKIISGVVFSDTYVFVTEFFQNAYRANATEIEITCDRYNGSITFKDNGKGLKQIEDISTLDYSNWETTNEGFGIGFWSWLSFDNRDSDVVTEIKCSVISNKFHFELSKEAMLNSDEPQLSNYQILSCPVKGFSVTLESELLKNVSIYQSVVERIVSDGSIMPMKITFNDKVVPQLDLLNSINGEYPQIYSNKLFDAKLTLGRTSGDLTIFYEKRKVSKFYCYGVVSGVIELKKNALNLKEPDRKDYAYDEKGKKFDSQVNKIIKDYFMNFLKEADSTNINNSAHLISEVLQVSEYEKFLCLDDVFFETEPETEIKEGNIHNTSALNTPYDILFDLDCRYSDSNGTIKPDRQRVANLLSDIDNSVKWIPTDESGNDAEMFSNEQIKPDSIKSTSKVLIAGTVWKKIDKEDYNEYSSVNQDVSSVVITNKTKNNKKANIVEVINKTKSKAWIKASEVEVYGDLLAKAQYYNIKVFIAKNVLYENVFEARKIPHLTVLQNNVTKRNLIKNVEIKTDKEKKLLELLMPICNHFSLPLNTFKIGELELFVETKLNNVVVNKEHIKNTKTNHNILGLCDGKYIYLDRRALKLKEFPLSNSDVPGKHEFRLLLSIINTVSHELSHLIYKTEDNTSSHFEQQILIAKEISDLYNSIA